MDGVQFFVPKNFCALAAANGFVGVVGIELGDQCCKGSQFGLVPVLQPLMERQLPSSENVSHSFVADVRELDDLGTAVPRVRFLAHKAHLRE